MLPATYNLTLAAVMFFIGMGGFLVRRNLLIMFMCVELMLNAVNLMFITYSATLGNDAAHVIVFFIMVVAAAEAAVGLALIMSSFRNREKVNIDEMTLLKH